MRLQVGSWYRIKGKVVGVERYEVNIKSGEITVSGFTPQTYAAYLCHIYIPHGDMRTVAEIEGIPYPEFVTIKFTERTKVTELTREEALNYKEESK